MEVVTVWWEMAGTWVVPQVVEVWERKVHLSLGQVVTVIQMLEIVMEMESIILEAIMEMA